MSIKNKNKQYQEISEIQILLVARNQIPSLELFGLIMASGILQVLSLPVTFMPTIGLSFTTMVSWWPLTL